MIAPVPKGANSLRWWKALTLIAAPCLVLEVALRAVGLGTPVLIHPDSACGYILAPNQNVKRFFRTTRTNSYGMRSDEFLPQKPPGALRLLFLGDSITYGTTRVDQSDIFTQLTGRWLKSRLGTKVEVLNASAGAWAISNELAFVRSRGLLEADLLVVVLNSGDLSQPFSSIGDVGDELPTSRPYTAIGETLSRYLVPAILNRPRKRDAGTQATDDANKTVTRNLRNLSELAKIVAKAGSRMMLIYIPFRRDIRPDSIVSVPPSLFAWAASRRVTVIDLTQAEAAYGVRDITLDGIHLNSEGNRLVSSRISPSLLSACARR